MRKVLYLLVCISLLVPADLLFAAGPQKHAPVNCDIHSGPCTTILSEATIHFNITPKPVKAMQELLFRIKISGKGLNETPYIDLGMPGMKMGPNHVRMKAVRKSVFEGKGVIVRCPSGKRIWRATVTAPGLGQAEFIFDVIY